MFTVHAVHTFARLLGARAALCMGLAFAALAGSPVMAQPAPSPELDKLAERAALQGSVRVIVGLNLAVRAEGLLTAQEAQQQRASIQAAQSAVADRLLAGTASRAHARFETIPFVGLEVDANGMARLRASGLVTDIQEDRLAKTTLKESTALVNAPKAWAAGVTGSGWTVAVLDTGVDKSHLFLKDKVVSEACYSSNTTEAQSVCPGQVTASTAAGSGLHCTYSDCDHGTHVAGIVAGVLATDGSSGVAKAANIIAVQVFSHFSGPTTNGIASYSTDQIKGLERVYALRNTYKIAAVNMSLGGALYTSTCDSANSAIKLAIDNLRSVGIATVIASGNNGAVNAISQPACVSTAVSVGATCDLADTAACPNAGLNGVAWYSNVASFLSLLAPGSNITSSVPGGYGIKAGTSMATPHVAGAWALLKQASPTISVTAALAHLRATGLTVNDARSGATVTGLKRIDLTTLPAAPVNFTLTVSRTGTGSGSVVSNPTGISCGTDCTEDYLSGTMVTLTAQAARGSSFAGWTGACTGTKTCKVTMSATRSVTATFKAR